MKNLTLFIAIALLNTVAKAQDESFLKLHCDKTQSTITYSMNHPLHAWTGESKEVTSIIVTDKQRKVISKVAVSVKFASFDSKNANRDSHAVEVTEALKYPNVTFASSSIKQEGNLLKVEGTLTFHGVSQPISFEATKNNVNDKIEVTGGFAVLMSQFNIEAPSLMGFAADDDIKITFKVVF